MVKIVFFLQNPAPTTLLGILVPVLSFDSLVFTTAELVGQSRIYGPALPIKPPDLGIGHLGIETEPHSIEDIVKIKAKGALALGKTVAGPGIYKIHGLGFKLYALIRPPVKPKKLQGKVFSGGKTIVYPNVPCQIVYLYLLFGDIVLGRIGAGGLQTFRNTALDLGIHVKTSVDGPPFQRFIVGRCLQAIGMGRIVIVKSKYQFVKI